MQDLKIGSTGTVIDQSLPSYHHHLHHHNTGKMEILHNMLCTRFWTINGGGFIYDHVRKSGNN
jgi:hypothetical protein